MSSRTFLQSKHMLQFELNSQHLPTPKNHLLDLLVRQNLKHTDAFNLFMGNEGTQRQCCIRMSRRLRKGCCEPDRYTRKVWEDRGAKVMDHQEARLLAVVYRARVWQQTLQRASRRRINPKVNVFHRLVFCDAQTC